MKRDQQDGNVCGLDAERENKTADLTEGRVGRDLAMNQGHYRKDDKSHGLEKVALNQQQNQPVWS
jgi:hypothetical protein